MKAYGALTYTWMPGNYSGTPAKIPATVTTVYTVTGTDGLGCTNSTTATLLVYPVPFADFTPDPETTSIDEPTLRFQNKSTNGHIFYWELGDGSTDSLTDVQHKYDKPGTYRVCLTARNQWNCESQVCKEVVILPEWSFYVPDAFSPNGDGKNDGFIGVGINVIQYEMWIFDRWGNKIYHCKSMNEPWDGRRDNNPSNDVAQEDVYVWRIKIKDVFDKKHEYIGHVTLVKQPKSSIHQQLQDN